VARTKKSLVLITVDCLRADHCGFYGYARPTTPFLDSLASESIVVSTAVAAGAPTYFSIPSILASRMPLALGRDLVGLAPGEDTLASALRHADYATGAFSAANPYISSRFGYDQGFDVFRDFLDYNVDEAEAPNIAAPTNDTKRRTRMNRWVKESAGALGLSKVYDELYFQYCARIAAPPVESVDSLRRFPSADVVVGAAESWVRSLGGRPFLLWIHLMDPHSPYYPPTDAIRGLTGTTVSPARMRYLNAAWLRSDLTPARFARYRQDVVDLYDAGIRWVDAQLARLVQFLQATGHWDDCVFALTADHGEEFLDHGRRYHAPMDLMDEIVRVPLLLRVPSQSSTEKDARPFGYQCSGRLDMVFSHLHLAPTLLDILDLPAPSGFQGASIWRQVLARTRSNEARGDVPEPDGSADVAVAESVHGCTNPMNAESLLAPRLLSVRDRHHKIVIRLEPGAVEEIYDLKSDPSEEHPLTGPATAEARKRLLQIAAQHMERTTNIRSDEAYLKRRLSTLRIKLDANLS
jgi:arylsulfatase A-like enzyme